MPRVSLTTSYGSEITVTTYEDDSASLAIDTRAGIQLVWLSRDELAGLRANITHALEEVKA